MCPKSEPLFPLLRIVRLRMEIDGEGVTSLVAGTGCPLSCKWCLNAAVLRQPPTPVTAQELYDRVKLDDLYFRATGGGVTFGGGEALLHAAFFRAFREVCGDAWHICAETSLHVPRGLVETAAETVDGFIIDIKDMNSEIYRRYTGGDAGLVQENLAYLLDKVGPERLLVRVPLIPDFNTPADCDTSEQRLRAMGVTRIDRFSYIRREV
ncbi:MAG: radical SAM protein [Faecousia sp.]